MGRAQRDDVSSKRTWKWLTNRKMAVAEIYKEEKEDDDDDDE